MPLLDAVLRVPRPDSDASQSERKRFSELLSRALAEEVAAGLRNVGFPATKPVAGGPSEKEFQGGLGPKRVDVSYADERHGLLLAVSVKTIGFSPFGKNLKNRFSDLCAEAITLHMRFPYSIVGALFAFPATADEDSNRGVPTFRRAIRLFGTISKRVEHSDPNEKFEQFSVMLYESRPDKPASLRLFDASTESEITETEYFRTLRRLFDRRNPHLLLQDIDTDV